MSGTVRTRFRGWFGRGTLGVPLLWMLVFGAAVNAVAAAPQVTRVTAVQRAGTRLVDIEYETFDADADPMTVSVSGYDRTSDQAVPVLSLTGDGAGGAEIGSGVHRLVWDAGADWPLASSAEFTLTIVAAGPGGPPPVEDFSLIPAGTNAGTNPLADGEVHDAGSYPETYSLTVDTFYMGTGPVSNAEWTEVRDWGLLNGYTDLAAAGTTPANHPVSTTSWYDAVKWCNARSEMDGRVPCYRVGGAVYRTGVQDTVTVAPDADGYRIPSSTEWEYAARGGEAERRFPWGETIGHADANYRSSTQVPYDLGPTVGYHPDYRAATTPYTSPVGEACGANGYGLSDTVGNVWEWCEDWYPGFTGRYRVVRGGSWYTSADYCRVGAQAPMRPANAQHGFRVAASAPVGSSTFALETGWIVSFDLGEHGTRTGGGELDQVVADGGAATAPDVTANVGWAFTGWDTTFDNVTSDLTVTAQYERIGHDVVFDLGEHGTRTGGGELEQTVDHGTAATAPEVTSDAGWSFDGWDAAFDNVTSDLTVTAQYTQITHTLTVASDHGSPDPAVGDHTYNWGDQITASVSSPVDAPTRVLPPAATTRYVCTGWEGTGSVAATGTDTTTTFTIEENSGITWLWDTEHLLTTGVSGNGFVSEDGGWYTAGTQVTITAAAAENHHFVSWSGDTAGATISGDRITVTMDGPRSITASFAIDTHEVTFDLGLHGSRTGGGELTQIVDHGSAATEPTVTPDAGWTFDGWDTAFDSVTSDLTVTAEYTKITHTLTVASDHGSPDPAVGEHTYDWGDDVTASVSSPVEAATRVVPATTRYVCTGWTGTGSVAATGSTTSTTFTVEEDSGITWLWDTEHLLTTAVSGNGSADEPGGWYSAGTAVTITATPAANHHFVSWSGDTAGATVDGATITVTMDGPRSITANFAIDTYTVEFALGDHGSHTGGGELAQTVDHGSAATEPEVTPDAGWTFDGWDVDFSSVTSDLTVTAQYTQITHTLTVASDHGSPDPAVGEHTYNWGDDVTASVSSPVDADPPGRWLPPAGDTRYVCTGWTGTGSVAATGTTTSTTFTIEEDSGITWLWDTEHQLTTGVSGNGSVDEDGGWYKAGTQVTITATADADHHFVSWSGDTTGATVDGGTVTVTMDGPRTITANFAIDTYTVEFVLGDHGTHAGGGDLTQTVDHGSAATAPEVTPDAGWTFDGWDVDFSSVTSDLTVTAEYTQITHTLTVASDHGSPDPAVGEHTYNWGDDVTASVDSPVDADPPTRKPAPGSGTRYVCTGWTGTGSVAATGTDTSTTFTIEEDSGITWLWDTEHLLTTGVSGNGSVDEPGGWYTAGTQVTITATPAADHHFVSWSGDTAGATVDGGTVTVTMDGPRTITANFAIDTHSVEFVLGDHGSHTGGGALTQTVDHGSAATAPEVTPDAGWTFDGWDTPFDNVTSDLTVTAEYTQITHTLTVASDHGSPDPAVGEHPCNWGDDVTASVSSPVAAAVATTRYVCTGWTGTGSVAATGTDTSTTFTIEEDSGITWLWDTEHLLTTAVSGSGSVDEDGGWYTAGTQVTITATPDADHHFVSWSGDTAGATVDGATITVTMDGPRTITANFAIDTHEVTFDLGEQGTRTGGGELTQAVAHGAAAVEPVFTVADGWVFTGWDTAFDSVTSDLTVTAGYGASSVESDHIELDARWIVTFLAGDHGSLSDAAKGEQWIENGNAAVEPGLDVDYGWVHTGWDTAFDSVTSDLTVTAVYERDTFQVVFDLWPHGTRTGGGALVQDVVYEAAAVAPTLTTAANWRFVEWDTDFSYITEALTVRAVYEPDWDGVAGDPTADVWTVYLLSAEAGGVPLDAGDEVSLFDGSALVGSCSLQGPLSGAVDADARILAFSVLSDAGTGYTPGNRYSFRCWKEDTRRVYYAADVSFPLPGGYEDAVFPEGTGPTSAVNLSFGTGLGEVNGDDTGAVWDITLLSATLGGEPLGEGDEIAIYDGDLLVGTHTLATGIFTPDRGIGPPLHIPVLRAYSTVLDRAPGYTAGNAYTFRCRDAQTGRVSRGFEVAITGGYDGAVFPPTDQPVTESSVRLAFTDDLTVPIPLAYGYQIVSAAVTPAAPDMETVCTEILDNLDFVRDSDGGSLDYAFDAWQNGIGDWNATQGYLVRMNAADTLSVTGVPKPADTPIALRQGYQFIAYLPEQTMTAAEAFAPVLDQLDYVRDSAGGSLHHVFGAWHDGIGLMQPGRGYLVRMHAPATLVYPAPAEIPVRAAPTSYVTRNTRTAGTHWSFAPGDPTAAVWTVYLVSAELDGEPLAAGDEIGLFDGETLVGHALLEKPLPGDRLDAGAVLVGFSTLVDGGPGFRAGAAYGFRVWDADREREVAGASVYWPVTGGYEGDVFPTGDNAISAVSLRFAGEAQAVARARVVAVADGVLVQWLVGDDTDVEYYMVERLVDGVWLSVDGEVEVDGRVLSLLDPDGAGTDSCRVVAVGSDGERRVYEAGPEPVQEYSIGLSAGWNLISIPCDAADLTELQAALEGGCWAWEAGGYVAVTAPQALQGLWVYAPESAEVTVPGVPALDTMAVLLPGWNLVGPVADCPVPGSLQSVFGWQDRYQSVLDAADPALLQTRGYWIYTADPQVISLP